MSCFSFVGFFKGGGVVGVFLNLFQHDVFIMVLKALSIAQRFVVIRLLLPVNRITILMSKNIHHLNLLQNQLQGLTHIIARAIVSLNVRAIVNLMCRVYVHHCRGNYAVMRKYSAYTESEMQKNQMTLCKKMSTTIMKYLF